MGFLNGLFWARGAPQKRTSGSVCQRVECMGDLSNSPEEQAVEVTEYSEALVQRIIEQITVYDEKLVF